jgi:hypothetical protein
MRPLNGEAALTLNLDALPNAVKPLAAGTVTKLVDNGSAANQLDILIVGDGYTADQQALFVPSPQSGASKPKCAETPGSPAVSVTTAFDATFCTSGIRRLVTVNESKVLAAAAAAPDYDHIFVIVNDTEYGGSGGSLAVATLHAAAAQLVQHEFGHSFTRLADEYDTAYPGFPSCSDAPGSGQTCEPNVTDQATRASIKWQRWLAADTPLPTVSPLADSLAAGLWEGARYQAAGMYRRQCYDGIMRSFDNGLFCHVDAEAFVNRLYHGGWGVPSTGVSNIEPGSTSPASNAAVPAGNCQRFAAKAVGPAGVDLAVRWLVDGKLASTATAHHGDMVRLDTALAGGSHAVVLTVSDQSPLVLDKPVASASWQVSTTPVSKADYERLFDWTEKQYPQLFSPAGQVTQSIPGYVFRAYGGTGNYVGVGTGDCGVYVLGPASGQQLLNVGQVVDFMGLVPAN